MNTYKALIFDLGKVVFDLSFDRVFQYWAAASNRAYEQLKSNFQFDAIFNDFEKDAVTPRAFRSEISRRLSLTLTDQEFDAGWCALYLDAYPGIDKLLAKLKQQYQLVALTNTNEIHSGIWKAKYASALQHFDKIFSSHELRERKPAAQAYQLVLDYLQVKPEQTVFLDDSLANVKGAEQLGIKAILVTSPEQMTAELRTMGFPVA